MLTRGPLFLLVILLSSISSGVSTRIIFPLLPVAILAHPGVDSPNASDPVLSTNFFEGESPALNLSNQLQFECFTIPNRTALSCSFCHMG